MCNNKKYYNMSNIFLNSGRCLFFIFVVTCCGMLSAQSVIQHDAISPNVGSLLRTQDVSINLYTGRPDISIPLYSINLKNFSYDIRLFYNAEGNKPDMAVGNVGLGWSITGGQISRIANGYPDEIYTFTEYLDRTDREDWYQESNLYKYYNPSGSNDDLFHEPDLDEFVINIGQINASFYMYRNKEGVIKTKIASQNSPYFEVKDVKIGTFPEIPFAEAEIYNPYLDRTFYPKISIKPRPVLLKEITIVDSNGVIYVFGGDINSVDLSCQYLQDINYAKYVDKYGRRIPSGYDSFGMPIYPNVSWEDFHSSLFGTPSTWHIKEITLPNGESIKFDYSKNNVNIMERFNLHKNSTVDFFLNTRYSSTVSSSILPSDVNPQYYLLENKTYDIVYPSLLTKISASNGDVVDFISSKRNDLPTYGFYDQQELFLLDNYGGAISAIRDKAYSYKLDEIKMKNRTVRFYYTDMAKRRLQLDSLKINRGEVYKFQYNPLLLPSYTQALTDNWGYYNGKKYFSGSGLNFSNLYAFRQPDSTYVKAEILEKIIYPTGGEADFKYELHTYSKVATQYPFEIKQENGCAGGVRVKKIIYSDKNHPSLRQTKEFLYQNEDGTSSGILSVVPQYTASGKGPFRYELSDRVISGQYFYDTQSDTQMNWIDHFHIGYSRVTELLSDGSKTVYSFINHDRIKNEPSMGDLAFGMTDNLQHKYSSRKLSRGLPQSIEYYNSLKEILKKETLEYYSDMSDYLKSINRFSFMGLQPIRVSANKIYTYFPFLQKKVTTLYANCDSINEIEEYEYNKYRLLTRKKKYTNSLSENGILETSTKYVSDLLDDYSCNVSSSIPTGSSLKVYDIMNLKRMLASPVETIIKRDGKVMSSEVMTYKLFDDFVVPDKVYRLENDIPLNNYSPFKLITPTQYSIDERCTIEKEYLDYDSYCNLTNVVDKSGIHTAYIWGYKGQYPIAKVVNARNTFKSIPKYRDVRVTKYLSLKYSSLSSNVRSYNFYTSKAGDVEIVLVGALGYNWYVTGNLDGNKSFSLIQTRCDNDMGRPWSDYDNAYTYRATFYASAGYHTLRIFSTDACKDPATSGAYDGELYFSHWTEESIAPETSGTDDVFYENFETSYVNPSSFGYNSNNSFTGIFPVSVNINPEKEYVIDYQVFKNGRWNYKKSAFINGCDTINEGVYPIDDVRVYPIDASISTYGYYPLIGLRSKTNERGVSESYGYNSFGELVSVIDNDMNVIRKYDYFYQNQAPNPEVVYYNNKVSKSFTRNTCDASLGELGSSIDYVVPAKKYSSNLSQEDANQKAYVDLLENGQQYANENGECGANIILSVYNPQETTYVLEFSWGIQGSIVYDHYSIPPSEKIADTGDILKDYKPVTVYLPRQNYRNVCAYQEDDYYEYADLSVKSYNRDFELLYTIEYYPDFQDTYVIGNYTFPDNLK